MTPLRVALCGYGSMGRNHARVLSEMSDTKVVAIYDPYSTSNSGPHEEIFVKSLSDLIRLEPDYCVVAVPTSAHLEVCLQLISSQIAFLVEKPLSSNLNDAEILRAAKKESPILAAVGHIERYNPAILEARSRLREGVIGRILQISTRRQGPYPARISDVGVAMDLLTHDIDSVAFLTDSTYSVVSAFMKSVSGRDTEDFLVATAELQNNAIISHIVNWLSPTKERFTSVMGEQGTLVIDTLKSSLTLFKNGKSQIGHQALQHFAGVSQGPIIGYEFERLEPLVLEHRNFIDALRGEPANIVTIDDGYEIVRTATAIIESSKEEKKVHL